MDTRDLLQLLGNFFSTLFDRRTPVKVERIEEWVDILQKEFSPDEWADDFSLGWACGYLARTTQRESLSKILCLVNDPHSPGRDFVLGLIVPRIPGITTDSLTVITSQRLVELYVTGRIEPFPSPGEIATERFITEIVLPYARSIDDDHWKREALERILLDAGQRHDRRYRAPWLLIG